MEFINYIGNALWHAILLLSVGLLPWIAVAFVMQLLSNSIRNSLAKFFGIQGYIYLTCPGVMIHEIGHAVFCLIFRHKIMEMKLFSPEDDGTLGYVNHSYNPNNFYHKIGNFFIGTGPIWFGFAILWLITWMLLPGEILNSHDGASVQIKNFLIYLISADFWTNWKSYLWLYLALTVASHITLSPPDLVGAWDGIITITSAVLFAFLFFGWCGNWESSVIEFVKNLFFASCGFLTFFVAILFIFSIVFKIITGKR